MSCRSRIRDRSGVIPVPIYTKPYDCGGKCIFCPRQDGFPNSYTENEDTLFAKTHAYSARAQFNRFRDRLGTRCHQSLPFEIILLGGSFSSLDRTYRTEFLSELYCAMLEECGYPDSTLKQGPVQGQCIPSVVAVESRPDQINWQECEFLRQVGVSKVELGVQHTSDAVLHLNKRGHDQSAVLRATRLLKDEGFKVGYHVMIGLPAASFDDDLEMLSLTLWKPDYAPDYLKIYPCVLLLDPTLQPELVRLHESGKWQPPEYETVTMLLQSLSKAIPPYVRISRVQRQFDSGSIRAGVGPGIMCRSKIAFLDIRAREVGRMRRESTLESLGPITQRTTRQANDIFIELESQDSALLGFIRLREREDGLLIIRELRVLGEAAPIGSPGRVQGKGLGSALLDAVETLGLSMGVEAILVNASPGARPYFRKHGYTDTFPALLAKQLVCRNTVHLERVGVSH